MLEQQLHAFIVSTRSYKATSSPFHNIAYYTIMRIDLLLTAPPINMKRAANFFLHLSSCIALLASAVTAFNALSIPGPTYPPQSSSKSRTNRHIEEQSTAQRQKNEDPASVVSVAETVPWRVVLDIGREPLANGLPFDWARSGCRMPLKIPCNFSLLQSDNDNNDNRIVTPISDTVSFTGPDGAVVKPIQGGHWSLTTSSDTNQQQQQQLAFDLTFPEPLQRRDVSIEAGTTLQCMVRVYTQSELNRLNDEFYRARDAVWAIGEELNDQARRRSAPKRWNEATQQWEKRHTSENPLSWAKRRLDYARAKAVQDEKNRQRPDANQLSAMGRLPGLDEDMAYVARGGVVRAASNGAVMGTWYAEPMVAK